jgi:hypothetical protein
MTRAEKKAISKNTKLRDAGNVKGKDKINLKKKVSKKKTSSGNINIKMIFTLNIT